MKKSLLILLVCLAATSINAAVQVYTVYDSSTKTMTYYCDENYPSLPDNVVKELYDPEGSNFAYTRTLTKHIVVDASMKNYNLTTTKKLFSGAGGFTVLEDITGLDNLNTAKVTNMDYMFYGCETIKYLWVALDLSKVQTMEHMFENCKALTFMDITHYNYITAGELVSTASMFKDCKKLKDFMCWDLIAPKLQDVSYMFSGCETLETAEFTYSEFPALKDANHMFYNCSKLVSYWCMDYLLGDKTENISFMFAGCQALKQMVLDPANHQLTALKNVEALFLGCEALTKVTMPCMSTATKLSNMNRMFTNCEALTTIACDADLSKRSASSTSMFENCRQLVGGNGTKYTSAFVDKTYARPDKGTAEPGYFTADVGALCATPTNPSLKTYTTNSATLQWTNGSSDQKKWEIVYVKDGGTEQSIVVTTNPYRITGLSSGTKYTAKVRAICSDDNKSEFSNTIVFETLPETPPTCDAPKNFEAQYITETSADISFTAGSFDQTKWWISITDGADYYVEETLTMTYYLLTKLTPNTTYSILAHAICSETEVSNDVSFQFTTLPKAQTCETPISLKVENIGTTSADVSFTPGSTEQTYWRYFLANSEGKIEGETYTTSFQLSNLKPDTRYELVLFAECTSDYQSKVVQCEFNTKAQSKGPSYVCDFRKRTTAHETFNDAEPWGYDNNQWGIYGGANKNGKSYTMELGGSSDDLATTNPVYIINWEQFDKDLTAIKVTFASGSLSDPGMSIKEWGLNVLDEYGINRLYHVIGKNDAITRKASTYLFMPATGEQWSAGYYFVLYWDLANTSDKTGVVQVSKIEYYTDGIPESIEAVTTTDNPSPGTTKFIHNGQLLILHNGKIFTITGQEVK